jgi:hypothetical protein
VRYRSGKASDRHCEGTNERIYEETQKSVGFESIPVTVKNRQNLMGLFS